MKAFIFVIMFVIIQASYGINIGDDLNSTKLLDHRGKIIDPAKYKDKIVVFEWFNEGCPYVRKHYDSRNMQNLQRKYLSDVVWITIVSSAKGKQGYLDGSSAAMKTYQKEMMASKHLLLDPTGEYGRYLGAKTTPHIFIFQKGKLAFKGAIDNISSTKQTDIPKATNYIVKVMDAIKSGKKIPKSKINPYGCSIKY